MTPADLLLIQSDAAEREQVRIIQALVTAEFDCDEHRASGVFEDDNENEGEEK